jgi:hypothetical protein
MRFARPPEAADEYRRAHTAISNANQQQAEIEIVQPASGAAD